MIQADLFDQDEGEVTKTLTRLLYSFAEFNSRISAGDIISAKAALPLAAKVCRNVLRDLTKCGAVYVEISPFVSAGGWVGVLYSYRFNGRIKTLSVTPRPMD